MSFPLKDKTALVTGASMGIGEAVSIRLANDGANLVLLSRSKDKLDNIKKKILSKIPSTRISVFAIDIQNYKDVDKAVESAVTEFGSIDILINNAGLVASGSTGIHNLTGVVNMKTPRSARIPISYTTASSAVCGDVRELAAVD